MGKTRRYIEANKPHALIIRVREGIPFVPTDYMNTLIESAMARALRDENVDLCAYTWMGNHAHMLIVPRDTIKCVAFYQELKKKVADYTKALLGYKSIALWEARPVVAQVRSVADVVDQIAYLYANPASADLVDTIGHYPGVSSFADFIGTNTLLHATHTKSCPWIRNPAITPLASRLVSRFEDRAITTALIESATIEHDLVLKPYVWLKAFGITTPTEIADVKRRILESLLAKEAEARLKRAGRAAFGADYLRLQPIMQPHTPPPTGRRIYVISSDDKDRLDFIATVRHFCKICKKCYKLCLQSRGSEAKWPPGAIRPHLPPVATAI